MSAPLLLLTSFVSLICRAPVTKLKRVEEKDFPLLYCKMGVRLEPSAQSAVRINKTMLVWHLTHDQLEASA